MAVEDFVIMIQAAYDTKVLPTQNANKAVLAVDNVKSAGTLSFQFRRRCVC